MVANRWLAFSVIFLTLLVPGRSETHRLMRRTESATLGKEDIHDEGRLSLAEETLFTEGQPSMTQEQATAAIEGQLGLVQETVSSNGWLSPAQDDRTGKGRRSLLQDTIEGAEVARATEDTTLLVRYSLLSTPTSFGNLEEQYLPQLVSSLILLEENLRPRMLERRMTAPRYKIYCDNRTCAEAQVALCEAGVPPSRADLINLDQDAADAQRMEVVPGELDDVNRLSMRRTLADTQHLPPGAPRLLLGTDISFVRKPDTVIDALALVSLQPAEVAYMWDASTFGGRPYIQVGWGGRQCRGLLADFVLLGASVKLTMEHFASTLDWFLAQPRVAARTEPPCDYCQMHSAGLHAVDQFVLAIVAAEAGSCRPLPTSLFGRDPEDELAVIHDKKIRRVGLIGKACRGQGHTDPSSAFPPI